MGKKTLKYGLWIVGIILLLWTILTFWVEAKGKSTIKYYGNKKALYHIMIVYDPDPIYNLDQQICEQYAETFTRKGCFTVVASVSEAYNLNPGEYELIVLCANTYNWAPDWVITGFIKKLNIENKRIAAITLGAGSTSRSAKTFADLIIDRKAILINDFSYWLWRPNDESRTDESNVKLALEKAAQDAETVYTKLLNTP
jgi:hypothetical protein